MHMLQNVKLKLATMEDLSAVDQVGDQLFDNECPISRRPQRNHRSTKDLPSDRFTVMIAKTAPIALVFANG